jgi:hypothetical protein
MLARLFLHRACVLTFAVLDLVIADKLERHTFARGARFRIQRLKFDRRDLPGGHLLEDCQRRGQVLLRVSHDV